ncbi:MAG: type III-B CRISPR module RAMP protein Cmr4 [Rhodocyclaceae bacterium]|nr:type III-B CRISPR module RAMP protein Cmr4 [Rhodocyclaceae bacterium]
MHVWTQTALMGIYTLTPTHFGSGQANGAVDLPIARDAATNFPILPATGIKGVMRDYAGFVPALKSDENISTLFGSAIEPVAGDAGRAPTAPGGTEAGKSPVIKAGKLAFTEARLIAYPVRSLNRGFLHVSCPLILETLARDLRSLGAGALLDLPPLDAAAAASAQVADPALARDALVLEDLVYRVDEVSQSTAVQTIASALAGLIPATEGATRERFKSGFVLIPDQDFNALMDYVVPVQARIKLGENKTTDDGGNLWYEERLPSDCLFAGFVGERRGRNKQGAEPGLQALLDARDFFAVLQIGGNETVGNGICRTTLLPGSTLAAGSAA